MRLLTMMSSRFLISKSKSMNITSRTQTRKRSPPSSWAKHSAGDSAVMTVKTEDTSLMDTQFATRQLLRCSLSLRTHQHLSKRSSTRREKRSQTQSLSLMKKKLKNWLKSMLLSSKSTSTQIPWSCSEAVMSFLREEPINSSLRITKSGMQRT